MSDAGSAAPKLTQEQRAAKAAVDAARAQGRERRAQASVEYERATNGLLFTKRFNSVLYAIMQDVFESVVVRVQAWGERYAWGEWSLFAIDALGQPKHQVDCCRELGLKPRRVSQAVKYLQERGYWEPHAKLIIPVIEPVLTGPSPKEGVESPAWQAFLHHWEVAHSADFEKLEVARATVEQIRKVRLAEYKKWWDQEKKARATLLETARLIPDPPASSHPVESLTPFEQSVRRHQKAAQGVPVDGGMHAIHQARDFLFGQIERMQLTYPKSEFASPAIDRKLPEHQQLVTLILDKLGSYDNEYLVGYVVWVAAQFKGLGKDNKGVQRSRPPGSNSGPYSLGLLVNWAEDYGRICGQQRATEKGKGGA